jgi:hypothetical protein
LTNTKGSEQQCLKQIEIDEKFGDLADKAKEKQNQKFEQF